MANLSSKEKLVAAMAIIKTILSTADYGVMFTGDVHAAAGAAPDGFDGRVYLAELGTDFKRGAVLFGMITNNDHAAMKLLQQISDAFWMVGLKMKPSEVVDDKGVKDQRYVVVDA